MATKKKYKNIYKREKTQEKFWRKTCLSEIAESFGDFLDCAGHAEEEEEAV